MFNPFKKTVDDNARKVKETVKEAGESVGWPMPGFGGGGGHRVSKNREPHFNKKTGRFHNPETGEFEPGSPPPDLDPRADRYRAKNGRFKKRSADLYDEREEERQHELWPRG